MSYRASQFHKRLDSVERSVRPEGSFAWRISKLSTADRETYNAFRAELAIWSERFQGEDLYIRILAEVAGEESANRPKLPYHIEKQLYPPSKFTNPCDIYQELREG